MAGEDDTVDLRVMMKRSEFWSYVAMVVWLLVALAMALLVFRYL